MTTRAPFRPSRRAVLGWTAALAPWARPVFAAPPTNPAVVIVGAGMAGLAAAAELTRAGVSFVVVEARDRIGGRAITDHQTLGLPFDLGAGWLHAGDHNPLTEIARGQGRRLMADDGDVWVYDGTRRLAAGPEGVEDASAALEEAIDAAGERAEDVVISAIAPKTGRWDRFAQQIFGPWEAGAELSQMSAQDVASQVAVESEYLVPDGLGSVVAEFGATLPVSLGVAVDRIRHGGPGVTVETSRGAIQAQRVIVTVPTSVLSSGRIKFDPPLPEAWADALAGLPMGLLNKLVIRTSPGALTDCPAGTWLYHAGGDGRPHDVLLRPFDTDLAVGFVGGDFARELERAGDAVAMDFHLQALVDVFGADIRRAVTHRLVTRWGADPWSLGAYSFAKPGGADGRRTLIRPLSGRVHFAGEAVAGKWSTQLAGAYLSGRATARAVIKGLG